MKKPLWMMAPLAIVASLALTMATAGTASATIPAANQAYGRWVHTAHMGYHDFGVFWEPLKGTHKKVLVVCSEPLKPYATVTVGDTSVKLPNLKPGGSDAVHAIVNQFMYTVNTNDEGEAMSLAVASYSTDPAVRADVPGVVRGANPHVRALYKQYVNFGNNLRGPYKETLHAATSDDGNAKVTVTLKSATGHGMAGLRPAVTATNATVSAVTATNSKGVATYVLSAKHVGKVTSMATFKGLPDWRTVTGGYSAGHQHFSGGHHLTNVHAKLKFTVHGTVTASLVSNCTSDCDTTVPVTISGKNPRGSSAKVRLEAFDTATGQVVGSVNVAPGKAGIKTFQLANGDGKTLQLRWYYLHKGKRTGAVHTGMTLKVVCPPKPDITISVTCSCSKAPGSSTVVTTAGVSESYTALFYQNGVLKASKVLTNGAAYTYNWSKVAVGDSLETDITTVDANGLTHKWDREITVNK